jgi:hypothetical protein
MQALFEEGGLDLIGRWLLLPRLQRGCNFQMGDPVTLRSPRLLQRLSVTTPFFTISTLSIQEGRILTSPFLKKTILLHTQPFVGDAEFMSVWCCYVFLLSAFVGFPLARMHLLLCSEEYAVLVIRSHSTVYPCVHTTPGSTCWMPPDGMQSSFD